MESTLQGNNDGSEYGSIRRLHYYSDSPGALAPLGLNEIHSSSQTVRTNTAGAARMDTIILHKVSVLPLEAL